jgi:4-hydroxythreonine-4-phosphate dehydrogenase
VTKHLSKSRSDLLVVTAGEPAGIGPELCLALADTEWARQIVVVADPGLLTERATTLGLDIKLEEYGSDAGAAGTLTVLPIPLTKPVVAGRPDPANAASVLAGLRRAVEGCESGEFAALVTGPLQKSVINDAGIPFSGHTEYLAALTDSSMPVMLLAAGDLRVALATTHLPLSDVPGALSTNGIVDVLRVLHSDLREKFGIADPEIIVCGLNPHAGEGGHLGSEDSAIIEPAITRCVAEGMRVRGPLPADTAFTPAAGSRDAVLAMYHDQGLPVVKFAGFGNVVNVTLGLPIIRTSVDHGTALDIAGRGAADPGSLLAAIQMAAELVDA